MITLPNGNQWDKDIDEEFPENEVPREDISKFASFSPSRGVGRIALVAMMRRISYETERNIKLPVPRKTINRLAYKLWEGALNSQDAEVVLKYANFLFDRLDGKPAQAVALSGEEGASPLVVQVIKLTKNADDKPAE